LIDQYIRQYGRRLYGLCHSLCLNPADADDLYQDTWLKVVKNISHYDPQREFEPWLTKICVNTYRNALRRAMRSPFLSFSDGERQDLILESVSAPQKEDYTELYDAIGRLPEKLRTAVHLFYGEGYESGEIGALLGVPAATVRSRLRRARAELRDLLGGFDDEKPLSETDGGHPYARRAE